VADSGAAPFLVDVLQSVLKKKTNTHPPVTVGTRHNPVVIPIDLMSSHFFFTGKFHAFGYMTRQ
jgi:hypothetical protein